MLSFFGLGQFAKDGKRVNPECVTPFFLRSIFLTSVTILSTALQGQSLGTKEGDLIIGNFLKEQAYRVHGDGLAEYASESELLASRPRLNDEFYFMLGLSPIPEKTPLVATKTGELNRDGYVVELMHFQSRPGLYVTGNLYRPTLIKRGERLPTILYVCGHADRGRNGNKAAYQSNGIWFARHGYICLVIDTLQRGEVPGVHHGTYRENRWWWHSRGYTSAGVECWNGIRAIDYLEGRTDVDPDRIGVTGISGGGAVTLWIAAADERVRVAAPISGMADLPSYVGDRVINGHCDCMFLHNTFRWPWTRMGELIAPRPLLFVNSDQDPLFPMDANERVSNRFESLYSWFGAGDQMETVVSMGGHAYREDIRKAVYRFMNIHLKGDPTVVDDSEVDLVREDRGKLFHPISPKLLRVFPTDADIPKDQRNDVIDREFVPVAKLDVPDIGDFAPWRKSLIGNLRKVVFREFPDRVPSAKLLASDPSGLMTFETEMGIEVELRNAARNLERDDVKRIVLHVNVGEKADFIASSKIGKRDAVFVLDPRGVGMSRWSSRNPPNYVARSHVLLGRTVDDGRVWDIISVARYLMDHYGNRTPRVVSGKGSGAVLGAYALALDPEIDEGVFEDPYLSHMIAGSPQFLNVLRVCDVLDVLGSIAPRPLKFRGVDGGDLQKVKLIYESARAGGELRID